MIIRESFLITINFSINKKKDFLKVFENGQGFDVSLKLNQIEYKKIRSFINKHWFQRIKEIDENLANEIEELEIDISQYHLISKKLNHEKIWSKKSRILSSGFVDYFVNTKLYKDLKSMFGEFQVSDEENLGWPNIYWRLVRPKIKNDIGPLHRDSWFWDLNDSFPKYKFRHKRLKVWIPICVENGLNGLMIEPESQKRKDIKFKGEMRHGIKKPVLLTSTDNINAKLVDTNLGDVIIFDDNLIHGGAINNGIKTRVSFEFTLVIPC